jgi:hypothetical protein
MAGGKQAIDWEAIEADYRAGLLSLRELSTAHKVSHVAIKKRADKAGWVKDLTAKIKAKAEELVNRKAVNSQVNSQAIVTERQIIEANAERIAQVRGEHRGDISRLRTLGLTLLSELEGQSADPAMLDQLGELMANPDDKGMDKLNELYRKIISTPSRVDSAKKVAETLKNAIGLEREAYGLDTKAGSGDGTGNINISF